MKDLKGNYYCLFFSCFLGFSNSYCLGYDAFVSLLLSLEDATSFFDER